MRHAVAPLLAFLAASLIGPRLAGADAAPPPPPAPVPAPGPTPTPNPTPTPPTPPPVADHGYLGFQALPAALIPSVDRAVFGITAETGVVVVRVFPGGPAEKAGMRVDDVLTEVGGHAVPDVTTIVRDDPHGSAFAAAFQKITAAWKPGAEVDLVVARGGKPVTLKAVPVDKATMDALLKAIADANGPDGKGRGEPNPAPPETADANRGYVGFVATPVAILSPKEKARFHVKAEAGVVAVGVVKGSPAEAAGLKNGDLILRFAGQELPPTTDVDVSKPASVAAYEDAYFQLASKVRAGADVAIVVERDGKPVTLTAKAVDVETMKKIAAAAGETDDDGEDGKGRGEPTPPSPDRPEKPVAK